MFNLNNIKFTNSAGTCFDFSGFLILRNVQFNSYIFKFYDLSIMSTSPLISGILFEGSMFLINSSASNFP